MSSDQQIWSSGRRADFAFMNRSRLYPLLPRPRHEPAFGALDLFAFFRTSVPLFRRVPDAALHELTRGATGVRRCLKGQYVCRTGDPATEVWVVKDGRLSVNQCGWKGNRLSIEVMMRGDVSGLASIACRTYPGEVVVTRDTTLIVIPRQIMLRVIEHHPVLAREILYAYGQRLHYIETLLYLSREKVEKRLAAALLYLYHKFGFTLPFSRAEIGEMAGTTPETAMRILKLLEDRKLILRRSRQVIITDLAGLKARMEPGV